MTPVATYGVAFSHSAPLATRRRRAALSPLRRRETPWMPLPRTSAARRAFAPAQPTRHSGNAPDTARSPSRKRARSRVVATVRSAPASWDETQDADAFEVDERVNGRYRIVRLLGKGGTALTYEAVDETMNGDQVVLKSLSLRGMKSWRLLDLFQREAAALQSLSHPAIPAYVDSFEVDKDFDRMFVLVQRKAPGASLQELMDGGFRFTTEQVRSIFTQMLQVLQYLGSLNPPVLHRDVKPSNIIVAIPEDGPRDDVIASLVDFGGVNSGVINAGGGQSSSGPLGKRRATPAMLASTMVGTYGYMAPEQFSGAADHRSDLYALGVSMLYTISGLPPSEIPQKRLKMDAQAVVSFERRMELGNIYTVMQKLIEPAPEDRYRSAAIALEALNSRPGLMHNNNRSTMYGEGFGTDILEDENGLLRGVARSIAGSQPSSFMSRVRTAANELAYSAARITRPAGTRVLLDRDTKNRLLRVFIPPRGFTTSSAVNGAFALTWTGLVGFWTLGALTGGAPLVASLFTVPFWWSGAKMAKRVADEMQSSTELVISAGGGQKEVYYFSLRVVRALGKITEVDGDARDLARAVVDTDMHINGRHLTSIELFEGVQPHVFGEDLSYQEQEWLAFEINSFLGLVR